MCSAGETARNCEAAIIVGLTVAFDSLRCRGTNSGIVLSNSSCLNNRTWRSECRVQTALTVNP